MLTKSTYVRAITFFTFVMSVIVTIGAWISRSFPPTWGLLLGCFVTCIVGILIFTKSDVPAYSFAGVSLLSISLGLMIGPTLRLFKHQDILQAVILTLIVMVGMSVMGFIFPKFFSGLGPFLLAGLILLIIFQFGQIIFVALGFGAAAKMPVLTWMAIVLFSFYVAYDWVVAMEQSYTWDNAIDASGSFILDAVNLFLRLLSLKSDD